MREVRNSKLGGGRQNVCAFCHRAACGGQQSANHRSASAAPAERLASLAWLLPREQSPTPERVRLRKRKKKTLALGAGPRPTLAANLSRSGVVGWSPYSTDLLISADEWEGTASAPAGRLAVGVCCYPTLPSLLLGGLHAPTAGQRAFPRNARSPSGCAHRRWRRWQRRRRPSASLLLDARRR